MDMYFNNSSSSYYSTVRSRISRKRFNQFVLSNFTTVVDDGTTTIDLDVDIDDSPLKLDTSSMIWYIVSFAALIIFFLIVSCGEWCCRRRDRSEALISRNSTTTLPPPSYEQFAPPTYQDIIRNSEKPEVDVYIVPVHALGRT
ncbi:hypothetical protein ABEB36_011533 [Hypothenemus hampei]|uniref:Uncharacterized protein n=1 Tax=Hypothenemus hampei TaxID=57062 RepID=A0ABD1E869_HYPHA